MSEAQIQSRMSTSSWVMLLSLSILWGGSFFFIEVILDYLPPLTIVLSRVVIAALTLWLVVLLMSLPRPGSARAWLALFGMGLLNNVIPFTLIVWGQTYISSGLASILNATTPLFGVVIAGLLLSDERMTPAKIAGVLVGFAGAIYMIGPSALQGMDENVVAQLAIIGAAISYGFAGVFGRRFRSMGLHPITTAAGQVTGSAVMLTPIALIVDRPFELAMPGAGIWLAVLALSVLCTALAYILYFRILANSGATNLLLVTFLIPVSAILLGSVFLGETLESSHYIGMAIIGVGLSLIDGRLYQRFAVG